MKYGSKGFLRNLQTVAGVPVIFEQAVEDISNSHNRPKYPELAIWQVALLALLKQVYRRRYESRRSSQPKLH